MKIAAAAISILPYSPIYIYIYRNIKFMRLVETATRNERQRYRNGTEISTSLHSLFPSFFFLNEISDRKGDSLKS